MPRLKIIILTMHPAADPARTASEAGVAAWLTKDAALTELLPLILSLLGREVRQNGTGACRS